MTNELKKFFPIFKARPDLVYLDSAASAQKPAVVVEAMVDYMQTSYANIHRGLYPLSQDSTRLYDEARAKTAQFLNAPNPKNIVFTKGTTESINLVANSYDRSDIVIVSGQEHHSNLLPWQKCRLKVMPLEKPLDWLKQNAKSARLIAITGQSNVLGDRLPLEEITGIAHHFGAKVLVDAAQLVTHYKVDVQDLDCDFLAFSAHKLYGPTGLGVLYGSEQALNELKPYQLGGDMVDACSYDKTTFQPIPTRFEAGTQPLIEAAGLAKALDFIKEFDLREHAKDITLYAREKLEEIEQVHIISPITALGLLSFTVDDASPYDIASLLGAKNICVRAGFHCAEPLHNSLNIQGSLRASFGLYNDKEDIDKFIKALKEAIVCLN